MKVRHEGEIIEVTAVEPVSAANEIKVYRNDDKNQELFTISAFAVVEEPEEEPVQQPETSNDTVVVYAFGLIVLIALLNE